MLDLHLPLKGAYWQLLNGNLSLHGENVPVFDQIIPDSITQPYVIISNIIINAIPETTNTNWMFRATVLLDIVTAYAGGFGGTTDASLLVNSIMNIILPGNVQTARPLENLLMPNFKVITTTLQSITALDNMNETSRIVRRLVRFNHLAEQITL